MATAIEYALMAGDSYVSTRDPKNQFPIPVVWHLYSTWLADPVTGFEASTYQNDTEIVISYAGTGSLWNVDWIANFALTLGVWSDQLGEAAAYYLQVRALNPDATISFTGHSLGGGLASLMSIFFGGNATTFDQAPFAASATTAMRDQLVSYLEQHNYTAQQLAVLAPSLMATDFNPAYGAMNVTNFNVAGEALSLLSSSRIGIQIESIEHGEYLGPFDLHSQSLLTAFLQSEKTAETGMALNNVTVNLPDLLKMIFDEKLYYRDPNNKENPEENFLERLVKHEEGNGIVLTSDAMVTRFTSDLWKLAQDGGMTLHDGNTNPDIHDLGNALIAFAMQKYYEEKQTSAGYKKELFTDLTTAGIGSNGIRFDMADVSEKLATDLANNQKLDLAEKDAYGNYLLKGYKNFEFYLNQTDNGFTPEDRQLILSTLAYMRDWYIQAGLPGMIASDANGFGNGAFMLGGVADDYLTGGSGADLLVGNAGDDILTGGLGSDVLIGGKGNDTYKYTTGDGSDLILDRDGNGIIQIDNQTMAGGDQYGDKRVYKGTDATGQKHSYVYVTGNASSGGDLLVDNSILIEDYTPTQGNHMGLNWGDPVADVDPDTTALILPGDYVSIQQHKNSSGIVDYNITNYTYMTTYTDPGGTVLQNFYYQDTAGNDNITTGSDRDYINLIQGGAGNGDDLINSGAGQDYVYAGAGNDVIIGGAGGDILNGGADNDRLYADTQMTVEQAIASGNNDENVNAKGDWLSGGSGDDTLVGSAAGDLLFGGGGQDLLIGGAGDDIIVGDAAFDGQYFNIDPATNYIVFDGTSYDWTVTQPTPNTRHILGVTNEADYTSPDGAADVIYAGKGNDFVVGGLGNDILFGGEGNDIIWGDDSGIQGNDYIEGGKGNDVLIGGSGNDLYVYNLGDGNDQIQDTLVEGDANTLYFGAGISLNSLKLSAGANGYLITLEDGSTIQLMSGASGVINAQGNYTFDPRHSDIQQLQFAGGSSITWQDFLKLGLDQQGSLSGTVLGSNYDDRLSGANSTLNGGVGSDTYTYQAGDGVVHIQDFIIGGDTNTLRFGTSISASQIILRRGSLLLDLGNGDEIHIDNFNADDALNSSTIQRFEFADGTSLSTAELLARGFELDGTANNDTITGTSITDRINGLGGNDLLFGMAGDDILNGGDGNDQLVGDDGAGLSSGNDVLNGGAGDDYIWGNGGDDTLNGDAGNDTLQGGAGNDILNGGEGDDVYYYSLGEGLDHITDSGGTDWLVLGNGAVLANLRLDVAAGSLKMVFGDGSELHLDDFDAANPLAGSIEYIQFSDGQVLSREQMIQALGFNIQGAAGDSVLSGTSLGETITAYGGNDAVTALAGNDMVNLGAGNDYADAGDGNDTVLGEDGNDTIYGGNGADTLNGGAGNDTLYGDAGADYLIGGLGDDLLSGGAGNDTLDGGVGNDTYLFGRGSGQDVVYDYDTTAGNIDKIQIAADVLPGDVTVRKSGANLYLSISNPDGTTDKLTFANWYSGDAYKIEQVVFADGTVWNVLMLDALINAPSQGADYIEGTSGNDVLNGLGGDDTLIGYAGDDTLDGGAGNDSLQGGTGNDTYLFGRGSGQDVVYDYDATAGNLDKIQIAADLLPSDVIVSRDQNHLYLSINNPDGTTDKLTLANWYSGDAYKVEEVEFADGTLWDVLALNAMLNVPTEGADIIDGTSSNDVLNGLGGNDTLRGYAGDDTLDGGTGNDSLQGGTGNDTYLFGRGSGQDIISDYDTTTDNLDKIQMAADVLVSDVTVYKNGANLYLSIISPGGTTDTLTLANWFSGDAYAIEQVVFADGTIWDVVKLAAMANPPTMYSDVLYGSSGNDNINGLDGDDTIYGLGGDDTLDGGVWGVDTLYGGDGNDLLIGRSSYDVLYGGNGDDILDGRLGVEDTLYGGVGNDTLLGGSSFDILNGGSGNDTYVVTNIWENITENINDGIDSVQSSVGLTLTANVENLTLTGTTAINGTGNELDNVLIGNSAKNTLVGYAGNDTLDGGAGVDTMQGGVGDDTYIVDSTRDNVIENLNEGIDTVQSSVSYTLAANVENLTLTGIAAINGTGNGLNNLLTGNSAVNTLSGGAGNDILQGGAGNDVLKDSGGNNLLDGGAGNDTLTGAGGKELFIGGAGNDTITTGAGADIIAFNKGDGQDTVIASTGTDNTISLGGGIKYANLAMSKSGNNLILNTGSGEQIILQNWYKGTSNHSVANLQIVLDSSTYNAASTDILLNHQVQSFSFATLASSFDQALATNPTLTAWSMTDALLTAHLAGSDTAALGGDLAYQYNLNNSLSGIGVASAQTVMNDANFGTAPQTLKPLAELQVGVARLG